MITNLPNSNNEWVHRKCPFCPSILLNQHSLATHLGKFHKNQKEEAIITREPTTSLKKKRTWRTPRYYPRNPNLKTRPLADIRGSHKCDCLKCKCKVRCYKNRKICKMCKIGNHTQHLTHRY